MDDSTDFLHISDLITKSLLADLTEVEARELERWRHAGKSHEQLYRKILSADNLNDLLTRQQLFSPVDSWTEFNERIHSPELPSGWWRHWLKYAAIFVPIGLLVMGGWLYFDGRQTVSPGQENVAVSSPGSSRAILVLDDGTEVALEEKRHFAVQGATVDNSEGIGTISYLANRTQLNGKVKMNRLIVPRGGEYHVELADGTSVYLNAETEFSYPVNFQGDCREVTLKGEGYFVVAHDSQTPFIVKTKGMNIRVLGTEFNVNAYEGQGYIATTLVKGSVEVGRDGKQVLRLKPAQQARLNCETSEIERLEVNVLPYTAWKDGKFVFNHEEMGSITARLEKWYDVKFQYADEHLKDLKVFGIISRYQNIEQVLELIRATRKVDFEYHGNQIIVKFYI